MSARVATDLADGSAMLSPCGRYRFELRRKSPTPLLDCSGVCCFVLLNPSTADAFHDDATVRRCIGFATAADCDELVIVNLFAYRTPRPRLLADAAQMGVDIVGLPENDRAIAQAASGARVVVCGWGASVPHLVAPRAQRVVNMLRSIGVRPHALALTANGMPAHPLRLAAALKPRPWVIVEAVAP